jgi:hypothetical protein
MVLSALFSHLKGQAANTRRRRHPHHSFSLDTYMSDQKNTDGISLEVKADGAAARVSDQALSRIGEAATWLMPRRAARVRITAALSERVAEKIRDGSPLNEDERFFVGLLFEKEGRLLGNREAAAEEIQRVLPEVNDRLKELPPAPEATPSQSFINRAEGIASEVSEDEIRQLFARLVAGEIIRPGLISLRTLETVRSLDARTARAFDAFCRFVINGNVVVNEKKSGNSWMVAVLTMRCSSSYKMLG